MYFTAIPRALKVSTVLRQALTAICLCLIVSTSTARPSSAQSTLNIAAVVNDEIISIYDLSQRISLVVLFSNLPNTKQTHQRIAGDILRRLIIEKLRLQEAERLGLEVPEAAIQNSISNLEKQNNIPAGGMISTLESNRIDPETLRQQVRAELAWIDVVRTLFRRLVTVSNEEVDDVIKKTQENAGKTEYLLAEIFLAYDEKPRQQIEQEAQRIYAQLGAGASWPQIAQNFSESASAQTGGDIGWNFASDLPPVLASVVAKLEPGKMSSPVTTEDGVYIVLLREKRIAAGIDTKNNDVKIGIQQLHMALPPNADAKLISDVTNKARTLAESADTCPAFASLAKSEGSPQSGFLGKFDLNQLNPQFRNMVEPLDVGGISQPLRTADGVIVLMVCSRESKGGADPIAAAREKIERDILNDRLTRMATQHEEKLRRQAFIEIRL